VTDPDISVVLATYNRRDLLPRAIASVLAQSDANFELLIVDDASTDGTADYLRSLNDPRIVIQVAENNLGPSGARNIGLKLARAPVVAFLDSDDAYLPRRLSAPLAVLAAEPTVVCVLSSARKYDRGVPRDARIPDLTLSPEAFEWALICDLIPVEATSVTVRRAAALAAGGFCGALRRTEDREFLIRLARHGAGRLIADVLWEKFWSDEGLSADWDKTAQALVAFVRQRPEYVTRFAKLGSYLATKVLVGHVRDRHYAAFFRDLAALRQAGLISANPVRAIADHLEVKRYRRATSGADVLARLQHGPETWR
jgi:glycosyltransferase involved in cell wall biosynthesis